MSRAGTQLRSWHRGVSGTYIQPPSLLSPPIVSSLYLLPNLFFLLLFFHPLSCHRVLQAYLLASPTAPRASDQWVCLRTGVAASPLPRTPGSHRHPFSTCSNVTKDPNRWDLPGNPAMVGKRQEANPSAAHGPRARAANSRGRSRSQAGTHPRITDREEGELPPGCPPCPLRGLFPAQGSPLLWSPNPGAASNSRPVTALGEHIPTGAPPTPTQSLCLQIPKMHGPWLSYLTHYLPQAHGLRLPLHRTRRG